MNKNISHLFFRQSRIYPEKIAIIERNVQVSYGELFKQIKETEAYFRAKGIQKGDRVLVFVPMSIDLYRITLALFSMGAVAVFLDEWVNLQRLKLCCNTASCKGIVSSYKIRLIGFFVKEIRTIPIHLSMKKRSKSTKDFQVLDVDPEEPALITFTTGSVGTPKAAVRTHNFLQIQFDALNPLLQNGNDRELIMLPIVLLLNLASGKTSIIADFKFAKPTSFDPLKIWRQINNYKIQGLVASPSYLIELAKFGAQEYHHNTIRTIVSGGSAIFPEDAKLVMSTFGQSVFTIVFGSTEAEPISHCNAERLIFNEEFKGVYVGEVDARAEVRIISTENEIPPLCKDEEFKSLLLNQGEIGEIIVAGPHVLESYLGNDEQIKANKIRTDSRLWHRTGDAGYMINDNHLFLMGRVKQIFTSNESIV